MLPWQQQQRTPHPSCNASWPITADVLQPLQVLAQPSPDTVALKCLQSHQLRPYDTKVDIWAVGVLIHEALTGRTPFAHKDPQLVSLKAQFKKPQPLGSPFSAACEDFVTRALSKAATERPTAAELLAHPWVAACACMPVKEAAAVAHHPSLNCGR